MSTDNNDVFDMKAARAKFTSQVNNSKSGRKARQKTIGEATDGRSLRTTGRTEHLNFKATPQVKALLAQHVGKGMVSLWLEGAIFAKLRAEGVDIDA